MAFTPLILPPAFTFVVLQVLEATSTLSPFNIPYKGHEILSSLLEPADTACFHNLLWQQAQVVHCLLNEEVYSSSALNWSLTAFVRYPLVLILQALITTVLHSACPLHSLLWPWSLQTEETLPCEAAARAHWAFHLPFSAFPWRYCVVLKMWRSELHTVPCIWLHEVLVSWQNDVLCLVHSTTSDDAQCLLAAVAHWISALREICQ